jgi:hypothetical protein
MTNFRYAPPVEYLSRCRCIQRLLYLTCEQSTDDLCSRILLDQTTTGYRVLQKLTLSAQAA